MTLTKAAPRTETMTSRERVLASLCGEETDRFPVWLKMQGAWKCGQPEPYRSMDASELLRAAGCDLLLGGGVAVRREAPHVRETSSRDDGLRTTVVETPDGTLVGTEARDPATQSWHPRDYMVRTADELRALRWVFAGTEYTVDSRAEDEAAERQRWIEAQDAGSTAGVGPGPLMNLVEHLCGPANAVYLMTDEPELFEETLAVMHDDRVRYLHARLPREAADTFWMSENTSTTLVSPAMFERYCIPHLRAYGEAIRENGIIAVHHMCGKLNALLEMIDSLPAEVNEAFTTRPVGDVSLAEGHRRMPSKTLMGGTNATLWLEPAETIVEAVRQDLARCPGRRRIFLTSAGVLPPAVSFEKASRVVAALREL